MDEEKHHLLRHSPPATAIETATMVSYNDVMTDEPDLHVAVNDLARVHVLDGLKKLVNDEALVDVLEDVGADDGVEVSLCHI